MYHIQKEQKIQDKIQTIYYQDINRWTTVFEDRKTYINEEDASQDISNFGGSIVSE